MRRLVRTLVGISAAAVLAALTAPDLGAKAEMKKQTPPAAEKKQATPAAEKKQAATPKHTMVEAADVKWGPAPPGLPAEAQVAVLDGDPGKPGLFTLRLKAPDGVQVQPHWHPADERVTVLSGSLMVGMGAKWDDSAMNAMNAGAYAVMPRRQNHYVRMKGETILQISAMGPFAITYVNPKDDPRTKK